MRFLITNDDGFDAPGLAALYTALSALGDVDVVAPAICHSSRGHAVNTKDELLVEQRDVAPFGGMHIAHASPADCVRLGLTALGLSRPDYVIAGVNPGANLGVDLYYSGTAAAAREAAIMGVRSIAVSRYVRPHAGIHWDNLATHVTRIVRRLTAEESQLPVGQFWNLNFPAVDEDHHADDYVVAPMGLRSHAVDFSVCQKTDNGTTYRYQADFRGRGRTDQCDVGYVLDGRIVATPVDLCTTAVNPALPD